MSLGNAWPLVFVIGPLCLMGICALIHLIIWGCLYTASGLELRRLGREIKKRENEIAEAEETNRVTLLQMIKEAEDVA